MEKGYDRKRQKQLTLQQGAPVILPGHADLWQGNSGQKQQIDRFLRHLQLMGETIYGQWDTSGRYELRRESTQNLWEHLK